MLETELTLYLLNVFQLKDGSSHDTKVYVFDADHERRRKEQLKRIFERTPEQVMYYNHDNEIYLYL